MHVHTSQANYELQYTTTWPRAGLCIILSCDMKTQCLDHIFFTAGGNMTISKFKPSSDWLCKPTAGKQLVTQCLSNISDYFLMKFEAEVYVD